jgi:hypothetical protein
VTGSTERPGDPPEDDDLLETGQEEVFSRAEVEGGVIEHGSAAGRHGAGLAERDEAQTERQAPDDAGPGEAAG